jgi:hypothetical protein
MIGQGRVFNFKLGRFCDVVAVGTFLKSTRIQPWKRGILEPQILQNKEQELSRTEKLLALSGKIQKIYHQTSHPVLRDSS